MRCVGDVDPNLDARWPTLPEESGLAVEPFVWWYLKAEQLKELWGDEGDEVTAERVIEMLKKMLVLDPSQRALAEEVCRDPWLKGDD